MANNNEIKIGLALSGGGVRAAAFHLGMLRFLAEKGRLENVAYLSTVSGGSLLAGLIYNCADYSWPSSQQFLDDVYPRIKETLTEKNLQRAAIIKLLTCPLNWLKIIHRANVMGDTIHDYWNVTGTLKDIPTHPTWAVNGTTSETGKRWRFKNNSMGDYLVGYVDDINFRIADVMAISAAFPGGIGPYRLKTQDFKWYRYDSWKRNANKIPTIPEFKNLFISDGGLYDNLGLESLYDVSKRELKSGVSYLVVSDASSPLIKQRRGFFWQIFRRTKRLIDVIYDQVRMLRIRGVVPYFLEQKGSGIYLQLGMTAEEIHSEFTNLGVAVPESLHDHKYLSEADVLKIANYPTNLKRISAEDFELIESHGYETAYHLYGLFPPVKAN